MTNSPLFRSEVLEARQAQWLGTIRIGQPLRFVVVTGCAVAMALALIGYSIWGQVTRKARLPGLLEPAGGLLSVTAPQAGVVGTLLVHEGDWVVAGQPLVRIRSERSTSAGDSAQLNSRYLRQRRETLEAEQQLVQDQVRERSKSLASRLLSLDREEGDLAAELENCRARSDLAQKSVARFRDLAKDGFVSDTQVQQKQEELLDVQLRQRGAERNLVALQRDKAALQSELSDTHTSGLVSAAQFERSQATLAQEAAETESRGAITITAPRAGRISAITQSEGQSVVAGQTLANLAAATDGGGTSSSPELRAYLFAPSRTAGFVRAGQTAWLRYAAYPYQKFGMAEGEVVSVSRTPIAAQDLPAGQAQALLGAAQTNEPLYRIQVRLRAQTISTYGQQQALKAGMTLEADVLQDRRAIWEWLLEPVLATTKKTV